MKCVFCKIIKKEIPSEIIFEDKKAIVIKDINPKARIHYLIIPKKHIRSIRELKEREKSLISHLIFTAKKLAKKKKISGYKLVFNVGKKGGQVIGHLHLHFLSGKIKSLP